MLSIINKYFFTVLAILVFTSINAQDNTRYIIKPVIKLKATAFNLNEVKLLPGNIFYDAMKTNATYLQTLDGDRFLNRWRTNAGLQPKALLYDGWEQTSSHMLGHYLSALVLQYAASGDTLFLTKANYIVDQLDEIQAARKTGYIGGIPGDDTLWKNVAAGNVQTGGFDLNGAWVPWYMLHKIWAGLLDAYMYTGNEKAKNVVVKLSDWACNQFGAMPDSLFQKMMEAEFGGMNESLAEVYAITGNQKYLDLSYKFYHKKIMDPLSKQQDKLAGVHANTQIPKIIGAARQYELTGNEREFDIAAFFFNTVLKNHTYANGGNSNYESFNPAGKFKKALGTNTSETCNTYNMLKLDKHLFTWKPSVKLVDYYERALYGHILASQHPQTGTLCYYLSLQSGTHKVYSTPYQSFWCCVGTGIENHSKYAENIYYKDDGNGLYINLFIPSVLNWMEKGIVITQQNNFPYKAATQFTITTTKTIKFPIHFRCPSWSVNGLGIYINGIKENIVTLPDTYITINRNWRNNDKIELRFNMELHTESMPDDSSKVAIFYGPILMAGVLGNTKPGVEGVPILVTGKKPVKDWIKVTDIQHLKFTTVSAGRPKEVPMKPFYAVQEERYIVYWDLFTANGWAEKKVAYQQEIQRIENMEKHTVDMVRFGDQQSEKDHELEGINTGVGTHMERSFRDAPNGGSFFFKVKVNAGVMQLLNIYNGDDGGNRRFEIFVNNQKIATENLKADKPGEYIETIYTIPENYTKGKSFITIKFQGLPGNIAGAVFESKILKQ